jgi:hypothetical protein
MTEMVVGGDLDELRVKISLGHFKRACRVIAEAARVDVVKEFLDTSAAMRAYAKQAKNRDLEAHAIEIRMRAIRRLDQLRQAQKATIGLAKGGKPYQRSKSPTGGKIPLVGTLAEAGINKDLAKEGRRLGALTQRGFENAVIEECAKVALRTGSLTAKPARPDPVARCVEIVKRAVANAAKKASKERVLKALWNEIGMPEDCGPGSAGEMARKDARIEELENKVRLLEFKIRGGEPPGRISPPSM